MAAGGHFGWPKIIFDLIYRHFRSIPNFFFCYIFFTKWLPAAILDNRKSLSMALLAISDQYAILFYYFFKMAAGGHFGSPIWAILDDRKSLSIAILAISDQYTTFFSFFFKMATGGPFGWPIITFDRISRHFRSIIFLFFHKMAADGQFGWPKITFDRISRHFRSKRNFAFFFFFFKMAAILEVRFAPKTIGFFQYVLSMTMPNMKLIGEFMTQLEMPQAFWAFLYKMAASQS